MYEDVRNTFDEKLTKKLSIMNAYINFSISQVSNSREVVKENKNVDKPSKLSARKKMFKNLVKINDFDGNTVDLTEKLFNEIAPKYKNANGGYTRIIKLVARKGDGAEMAIIELI